MEYTGQALTKNFEGLRLTSYMDLGGVWTIGYGHTKGVCQGMTITQAQADAFLEEDMKPAVDAVNSRVKVPITQNQFNALVDFVFNVGSGAFENSTLLRLLNSGKYKQASEQFVRWDKVNGKSVFGLLRRRIEETRLFNGT